MVGNYTILPTNSESPETRNFKEIKTYILIDGQLYRKLSDGILARCIDYESGNKILEEVPFKICGIEGPILARRIQRMRFFWPELKRQAREI